MSGKDGDTFSVKQTIRALLMSAKNGLTLVELSNDYKAMVGHSIPVYELGYSSLIELLKSMPDAVSMRKSRRDSLILTAIADSSSQHIASMISKQKNTKPYSAIKAGQRRPTRGAIMPPPLPVSCKTPEIPSPVKLKLRQLMLTYTTGLPLSKFQDAFNRRYGYYLHATAWGFDSLAEALHTLEGIVRLELSSSENEDYVIYPANLKPELRKSSLNSLEGSSYSHKVAPHTSPVLPSPKTADPVPVEVSEQIREILESSQGGIWATDLPFKYKSYFNEELPMKALGYTSVVEMLANIPKVAELERPTDNGDWLVFAKGKKTLSPLAMGKSSLDVTPHVPSALSTIIYKILENTPSPVTVSSFPTVFKNASNRELPLMECGFSSVEEFLQQVPDIDLVPSKDEKEKLIVLCKSVTEDEIDQKDEKETNSSIKPAQVPPVKFQSSSYSRPHLPQGSKAFGVYVTYVKTPSYLCVQIIGEDTTQALDSLHEDIAQFYNGAAGDKCAIETPVVGMPCCTRFNNDGYWYRASVINIQQPDIVEVRYVDYGNTGLVPVKAIRQPKPHYLALPAQAIECRLANIIPLGSTWSKRACQVLFEMTKDKAIAAIISSVKERVVSLCLCDTTTERDIHINDCLVNQGLALLSTDIEEKCEVYELEKEPDETSEGVNVRLPNTASSVGNLPKPLVSPTVNTAQLSQQQMMFQLMALWQQQSLLLQQQQPSLKQPGQNFPNPFLPSLMTPSIDPIPSVSVNSSVPAPPGFKTLTSPPSNFDALATSSSLAQSITNGPSIANGPSITTGPSIANGAYAATSVPSASVTASVKEYVPLMSTGSTASSTKKMATDTSHSQIYCMRKMSFPKPFTLHLVRYNDRPYAVSNEISSWFWESDLLQYKLHQIPNSPCGQLIYRERVPELFELLVHSQCPALWGEAVMKETLVVYTLEDLPLIVKSLNCPITLYTALSEIVKEWKEKRSDFWTEEIKTNGSTQTTKENDLKSIKDQIKKLQVERTSLLSSLMEKSTSNHHSISNDKTFTRFISLDKEIENLQLSLDKSTKQPSNQDISHTKEANNSTSPLPSTTTSVSATVTNAPATGSSSPLSVSARPFLPSKPPSKEAAPLFPPTINRRAPPPQRSSDLISNHRPPLLHDRPPFPMGQYPPVYLPLPYMTSGPFMRGPLYPHPSQPFCSPEVPHTAIPLPHAKFSSAPVHPQQKPVGIGRGSHSKSLLGTPASSVGFGRGMPPDIPNYLASFGSGAGMDII